MTDYTVIEELFKLNRNIEDLIRKVDELTFALRLSNQRGLAQPPFGTISHGLLFDTFGYIPQSDVAEGVIIAKYPKDGFIVNSYTNIFANEYSDTFGSMEDTVLEYNVETNEYQLK